MIQKSQSNIIQPYEHLYQLYHDLPKYINDPNQQQIIKTYDLILKRFQGIYGKQPTYFIRSPASAYIFGSSQQFISLSTVSFCSSQNIIIAIAQNGYHQIRFNHYQNAIYGQKIFSDQVLNLKYQNIDTQQEYYLTLIISLKIFASLNKMQTLSGLDILIYDDFIKDYYLNSKQALFFGLYTSLHIALKSKIQLKKQILQKFIEKVKNIKNDIKKINLPLICNKNKLTIQSQNQKNIKQIIFPKNISFVIANSMTPLPKKLIKGKRQNLRNCQILIGIQIIKNQLGILTSIKNLKQLQKCLDCTIYQLIELVQQYIPKGNINSQEIHQLTQKLLIDILKQVPYANNVIDENINFNPYNRIMFYLTQQILISQLSTQNIVEIFNKSYQNSKKMLQIGSEQIQQMMNIVQGLALGWKIIGNGWGGNILFICNKNYAQKLVDQLTNQFYMNQKNKILLSDDVEQYIKIVNGPATGLSILNPQFQIWY